MKDQRIVESLDRIQLNGEDKSRMFAAITAQAVQEGLLGQQVEASRVAEPEGSVSCEPELRAALGGKSSRRKGKFPVLVAAACLVIVVGIGGMALLSSPGMKQTASSGEGSAASQEMTVGATASRNESAAAESRPGIAAEGGTAAEGDAVGKIPPATVGFNGVIYELADEAPVAPETVGAPLGYADDGRKVCQTVGAGGGEDPSGAASPLLVQCGNAWYSYTVQQ